MCPLDFLYPGGGVYPRSRILNAMPMFDISKWMASCQKVFWFLMTISTACSTEVGISMPYLCFAFLTRELTAATILSRFRRVKVTHQAKSGSSSMLQALIYSSTSIGFDSLISLRYVQVTVPYFYFTWNFHPAVVFRMDRLPHLVKIHWSFFYTDQLSLE